jgi:diguanylate cyclase
MMDLGTGIDTRGATRAASQSFAGHTGHPYLSRLDKVRQILVNTGLPPEPPVYEVFYHHVAQTDASLSQAVDDLLAHPPVQAAAVEQLRHDHLGVIDSDEMAGLLTAAHAAVDRLTANLDQSHDALADEGRRLADSDARLATAPDAAALAALVDQLRQACTAMMKTNRHLTVEIDLAKRDTGRLMARLEASERLLRTDELTGLLNRQGSIAAARSARERAGAPSRPLAVALVELDRFMKLYDQWGPAIGNEALRCVGQHLHATARTIVPDAFAGRMAGYQFLIVLPGVDLGEGCAVVDRLRASLARQVIRRSSDGASLGRLTFSAGVAVAHREEHDVELLIDRADAALYSANHAGGDRVLPERPE